MAPWGSGCEAMAKERRAPGAGCGVLCGCVCVCAAAVGNRGGEGSREERDEGEIDVRGFSLAAVDERGSEGRCEGIGLGLG